MSDSQKIYSSQKCRRAGSEPKEGEELLPILRLRHGGAVRGLPRGGGLGGHVGGEREAVFVDELDILGLFQGRGRSRGEDDGRDAAVAPSLLRGRAGGAERRRCRRRRHGQPQRGRRLLALGLGGVPLDAGLHHEVDRVSVLHAVLLQQLGVRQRFALEQEPLGVCGGRAGLRGDLALDGGYGICRGDGYRGRERRLEGLECDLESGRR